MAGGHVATDDETTLRTRGRGRANRLTRTRGARRARADSRAGRVVGRVLGGRRTRGGRPVRPSSEGRGAGIGPAPLVIPAGGVRQRRSAQRGVRWIPRHDQLLLIASLVEAGVTLDVAFDTLATTGTTRVTREAAASVRDGLRAGLSLSLALDDVGAPHHVRALVLGGERVGRIAPALRAAADLLRRIAGLKEDLRRALLYPGVVLALGLGILVIVALVVVPPLERTFADLGGELPAATRAVLAVSRPLRSPGLVGLVAGLVAVSALLRRHRPRGIPAVPGGSVLLRGRIEREVQLAIAARLMATMLGGGLPLIDALRTTQDALRPGRVGSRVRAAASAVEMGRSPLADDALGGLLDPVERELLAVAERTGLLAEQWERVAQRRTDALTARIGRIGAVAEPLLVVTVGALVGGAVLALYLPTFRVLDLL